MDGWNPAKMGATGTSNFDVWATFTSGGSLITRQIQGDGVDQHLAFVTSSTTTWYLVDNLGSTRATINNSGTVQDSLVYDAYGNLTSQSSASAEPLYTYTGREVDVETGLQYNRARWYDPGTGRWITQDPTGFDAGDSNLCRYVNNRPMVGVDPSGLAVDWSGQPTTFDGAALKGPVVLMQRNGDSKYIVQNDPSTYASIKDVIKAYPGPVFRTFVDLTPPPTFPLPASVPTVTTQQLKQRVAQINANAPNGKSWLIEQLDQGKGTTVTLQIPGTLLPLTIEIPQSGWDKGNPNLKHTSAEHIGVIYAAGLGNMKAGGNVVNAVEVWVHANPSGMSGSFGLGNAAQATALGTFLKGLNWNNKGGGFVILSGCNVGLQKNNSFCQTVANAVGRGVYGAMGYVWGNVLQGTVAVHRWTWYKDNKNSSNNALVIKGDMYDQDATNWGGQDGLYRWFVPA